MHLVQVDVIGAQALQRFLDLLRDGLRRTDMLFVMVDVYAHLGRQNDVLALAALDGLAYDLFGMAAAIARRGINGRDARIQRCLDGGNALRIVYLAPKIAAHAPGAQGNDGHVQIALSQFPKLHPIDSSLLVSLLANGTKEP